MGLKIKMNAKSKYGIIAFAVFGAILLLSTPLVQPVSVQTCNTIQKTEISFPWDEFIQGTENLANKITSNQTFQDSLDNLLDDEELVTKAKQSYNEKGFIRQNIKIKEFIDHLVEKDEFKDIAKVIESSGFEENYTNVRFYLYAYFHRIDTELGKEESKKVTDGFFYRSYKEKRDQSIVTNKILHSYDFSFAEKNDVAGDLMLKNNGLPLISDEEVDIIIGITIVSCAILSLLALIAACCFEAAGEPGLAIVSGVLFLIFLGICDFLSPNPIPEDGYAKEKSYNQFPQITNMNFFKRHPVLLQLLSKL